MPARSSRRSKRPPNCSYTAAISAGSVVCRNGVDGSWSFQVISSDIAVLPIRVPSTVPPTSRKAPAVPLRTVVVDIEGTTSATAFVVDRLYPYSAERFADWIDAHHDDPETARAVDQVRELIGEPAAGTDRVVAALRAWKAAGHELYVSSSGSVTAQRSWFRHSIEGDLLPLLSGHFDTTNAGPKRSADSYRKITALTGADPARTVFLSDV